MAESFSVKAILSAVDSGFSSTLKSASSTLKSLGAEIKSGLGMGVLQGIGQQAFSTITGSVKSLFSEAMETSDAMQKLQQAMRFSGTEEAEIERIAGSTGTLKTYADKTVFSLQDVMSTFGALSANGVKDADKLTESVGNAVAVFGGGANEFSSVALAFSQSMAAGKMNAQDWNQVLNASPQLAGGLKKELQRLNPVIAKDFKGAMEDGKITAELLGKAMNNIGMDQAAKDAASSVTTWEGAMGNLEATVSSGLMTLYDSFGKGGLISAVNALNGKVGSAFDWLSTAIPSAIEKITPYWTAFKESFKGVGTALGDAFSAVKTSLSELTGAFGSAESVEGFKGAMQGLADAIKSIAGFITEHSGAIATLIKYLPALVVGFKGLQIAKTVAPGIKSVAGGFTDLFSKITGKKAVVDEVSESLTKTGTTSATTGAQMLNSAKSFALMGVAVLLIAAGFALLAQSSIALASSGGLAIGVMAGMVVAVAGLGIGMAALLKSLAPISGQLMPVATAFLAMGAAVVLIAAGFAILAFSSIALANAGGAAIGVMVGMVAAIALLAVGAAALGTSLTAGAVGFIAFGAAVLMVGAGFALIGVSALLAATALTMIVSVLPQLTTYGLSGAAAIVALGAGLIVFGAGALAASASILAFSVSTVAADVALVAFGIAMTGGAAGTLLLVAALKGVNSSMKSIAKNAKTTQKSLKSMNESVNAVESGLSAIGDKAKSALNSLKNVFDDTASEAESAGKKTGTGFTQGLQPGLIMAIPVAKTATEQTAAQLRSGYSSAFAAGSYISVGFAQGMRSQLGAIRSAAEQMAAAADKAVRAKAKIHSPSKVADSLGTYWGEGYIEGLESMLSKAWRIAEEFVAIPQVAAPVLAGGFSGELSSDYEYSTNARYKIEVPLNIDGREFAKAEADYLQDELNKKDLRANRKLGRV